MSIAVIGAGSWGTALAQVLATNGHDVRLWARKEEVAAGINEQHRNPRYLVDADLSERIVASTSHAEVLDGAESVVVVTPSAYMREVAESLAPFVGPSVPVVICSKGVEQGSGMLPVQVFADVMGHEDRFAVLSGPNHAEEIVKGIFAATVIASSNPEVAAYFQKLFGSPAFRTYASDDVTGVELCAAFKNVIAIAVGISYGTGMGDNTASALITRGLAEMSRLIAACDGQAMTCMGLAGTGDMIATCMSPHSRNRRFGELVAHGGTLDDFTAQTHMVAEGALACRTIDTLAQRYEVELPITNIVRKIVWEGGDVQEAVQALVGRPLTKEFHS